jgi:hypothetical protein
MSKRKAIAMIKTNAPPKTTETQTNEELARSTANMVINRRFGNSNETWGIATAALAVAVLHLAEVIKDASASKK